MEKYGFEILGCNSLFLISKTKNYWQTVEGTKVRNRGKFIST
jgi:hypothetical protein